MGYSNDPDGRARSMRRSSPSGSLTAVLPAVSNIIVVRSERVVGRPGWQSGVAWFARTCKGSPGTADLPRQLLCFGMSHQAHGQGQLGRMEGAQPAAAARRIPGKVVHKGVRSTLRKL